MINKFSDKGFWIEKGPILVFLVMWLFYGVYLASCDSARPKHPSRDEVVASALVGWNQSGYTDPREIANNRVGDLQIKRAISYTQYADFCARDIRPPMVRMQEELFCLYLSLGDSDPAGTPVILLYPDIADEEWGMVSLHGVTHYFVFVVLGDALGDDCFDRKHYGERIWGPNGAEEVARWEL